MALMPLEIRPTIDLVFKLLFGSPENAALLIHLLNAVLDPKRPIDEVEILNPFKDKTFEEDKLSIVAMSRRGIHRASDMWLKFKRRFRLD
jgi:hypothetical protein